jgi:voltage-gated potassium channel Kch
MQTELIRFIAENDVTRKNVITYLKELQGEIADVRNYDYTSETRLLAIKVIEDLFIKKLNVLSRTNKGEDEE